MVARVQTIAFQGIEAVPVDVQVMIAPGKINIHIVGLPDKAVAESRERVQAALHASGLSMPAKKVTVNLAPADLPKEGSHYDLPIALGLMAALGAIPGDALSDYVVLGELSLDGTIAAVAGALPAAIGANALGKGLICPAASGPEAAWAGADIDIVAPRSLIAIANHFRGTQIIARPQARIHVAGRRPARPRRHQGPGERQAGARGGGGRRPQSPDGRTARLRQVDAGAAAAVDPAAAVAEGTARSLDDRLDRRRARRRQAHQPPPVPRAASFGLDGGDGRRRPADQARRSLARPSRRAVPRRIPGIHAAGAGFAAPADRDRRVHDRARQQPRHLSGAHPAGRRDEPVPMRHGRRAGLSLRARRRAARPTTRRASRARCSTASTCASRCRRCRRAT